MRQLPVNWEAHTEPDRVGVAIAFFDRLAQCDRIDLPVLYLGLG